MSAKIQKKVKKHNYLILSIFFSISVCCLGVLAFIYSKTNIFREQADVYLYDSQVTLANENSLSLEKQELFSDDLAEEYEEADQQGMENADKYTLDEILEENDRYNDFSKSEAFSETAKEYVFDKNDWRLILVNKQHPVPEGYTVELETIKGSMQCDARIIGDLIAMFQAADEDGVNLAVCSPYRDISRQEWLFERKIKNYLKNGMSYMEAYSLASQIVMVPGASEHQLGLAIDINSDTYTSLDVGFADTEAGKWLAEHCWEYGFILRYPLGKEYITGVEYEPWHFRYVGKEAAKVITEQEICLEEFIEGL
ncbi:MAG: M15 family metallopeptidase [Lachnospiraceae bacterium]|nr:M15 family metallopeptidase [Lachnospiraceae bacterium]